LWVECVAVSKCNSQPSPCTDLGVGRAAQLLADANVAWAAVRSAPKHSAAAEGRLMDALLRACKDTVKAAHLLIKALLAPKGRKQAPPGAAMLETTAAVSHELVGGMYDVLAKSQADEQRDPNADKGALLRVRGHDWHTQRVQGHILSLRIKPVISGVMEQENALCCISELTAGILGVQARVRKARSPRGWHVRAKMLHQSQISSSGLRATRPAASS
jgi:hypothetical protein